MVSIMRELEEKSQAQSGEGGWEKFLKSLYTSSTGA
jgi:hypothetical protein